MAIADPIRYHVRNGDFGVVDESGPHDSIIRNWEQSSRALSEEARDWRCFSFNIAPLANGIDQGQDLDLKTIRDCRLPYPCMWLEGGTWAAYLKEEDGNPQEILVLLFCRGSRGGVVYRGYAAVNLSETGSPIRCRVINGNHLREEAIFAMTYFSLFAVELINSRKVEIHYRGKILKEHVPQAPTCPIKMSVMPTIRLREGVSLRFESGSGRGEPHKRGKRWHCVMAHPRCITDPKTGGKKQTWVKSHWRGNKDLGTVRPDFTIH